MIQLNDKLFETFIRKEEINDKIAVLASEINSEFKNQDVIFIAILNGSFMFASDLMKKIDLNCEISFIKVSSYVGTTSTGRVDEIIGLNTSIANKNVIIVEDIVDTGITMDKVITLLSNEKPASLKICTLLYKEEAFKGKNIPHYIGFNIPNKFVVGYGLDYNEKGRNLDEIYQLKEN
ncbi:MAG: hypoxanthine phosphoribosyltransferase [Flavobacteriia bacterium]|nr:hypoxanthine phosphoribosyltransferase [Flavobacteriia bacterium]